MGDTDTGTIALTSLIRIVGHIAAAMMTKDPAPNILSEGANRRNAGRPRPGGHEGSRSR
jgi:hypothetical protein